MEGKEELIISAINELKDEQKETRKEISTMNKTLASLASYHQRLNKIEDSIEAFNPFEVKGDLLACRFPMTAMEIFGIMAYLEAKGLVNILSGNDGFGTSVKTIDWDNIPANGFAICMVQEMVDVHRVEVAAS